MSKITFETDAIELSANGMATPVTVDVSKIPVEVVAQIVAFGLKEMANNRLASAKKLELTGEQRTEAVREKVDALYNGQWAMRASAGPAMTSLEKHTRAIGISEARATVKALLADAEFEVPRKIVDFLETEYELSKGDKTVKITGQAILDNAMKHPKVVERAELAVANEEAEKKAAADMGSLI